MGWAPAGLSVTDLSRSPRFRETLLKLAASRILSGSLCQPGLPSPSLDSTAKILFFLFRRPIMLTFSANTSSSSKTSLQGDKCSFQLAGVPPASDGHGLSRLPLAEPPSTGWPVTGAPLSILTGVPSEGAVIMFCNNFRIPNSVPTSGGGQSSPLSRALIFGKATLHLGGRLPSQRAPLTTDSFIAFHPLGTSLTS